MKRLTEQVHELLAEVVCPGDIAIDATAGNGHDTLFLAQQVGPAGCVYAFDIQQTALDHTQARLNEAGIANVVLHRECHSRMSKLIPESRHGSVAAVTFNLGYLPSGDKTIITKPETSVRAIQTAVELLRPGGIITVLCYTGHPGGLEEADAIEQALRELSGSRITLESITSEETQGPSPKLFVIRKK
ncbi:MAG TPA: class I SAM-dependent methyltransferase [Planctomycetaceae bacterium]|nr:class I SAM-dependent methyltransferase [Planctomycetaceae bacterium]